MPHKIIKASIVNIKRFKSLFNYNKELIEAHLPNTGSMLTLKEPGRAAWLIHDPAPHRKLAYRAEAVASADGIPVGVYSARANDITVNALPTVLSKLFAGYDSHNREVKYLHSRFDLQLTSGTGLPTCFVEVKSVQMVREPGTAEFPDAVTARGVKHLEHLMHARAEGYRCVLLFCVQRHDAERVRIASDIDPAYARAVTAAAAAGVEFSAFRCRVVPAETVVEVIPEKIIDVILP